MVSNVCSSISLSHRQHSGSRGSSSGSRQCGRGTLLLAPFTISSLGGGAERVLRASTQQWLRRAPAERHRSTAAAAAAACCVVLLAARSKQASLLCSLLTRRGRRRGKRANTPDHSADAAVAGREDSRDAAAAQHAHAGSLAAADGDGGSGSGAQQQRRRVALQHIASHWREQGAVRQPPAICVSKQHLFGPIC